MKYKKVLLYFIGSMLGIGLYELAVYIWDPYEPEWGILIMQAIVISVLVAILLSVYRWARNKYSNPK